MPAPPLPGEAAFSSSADSPWAEVPIPTIPVLSPRGASSRRGAPQAQHSPPMDVGSLCDEIRALLQEHQDHIVKQLDDWMARQEALVLSALQANPVDLHKQSGTCSECMSQSEFDFSESLSPAVARMTGDAVKQNRRGQSCSSTDSDDWRRWQHAIEVGTSGALSQEDYDEERTTCGTARLLIGRCISSNAFEIITAIAILGNSILIGAELQSMVGNPGSKAAPAFYRFIDYFFTMFFLVELLLRCFSEGVVCFFYRNSDWAWNAFDAFLVATSIVEIAIELVLAVQDVDNTSNLRIIRSFRIVRISKALRIQRVIRFISALKTLVYSIFVTIRSVVWALVLLLIVMYIFAIVILQSCIESLHEGASARPGLHKFWGSLGTAVLTLFESVTGGISWYEVVAPLWEVHAFLVLVFTAYIFLITFAVFNVITGVFCHSAIETAVRDPELAAQAVLHDRKMYVQRVKRLFQEVDVDQSGMISLQELQSVVRDENIQAIFAALDLDLTDTWAVFKLIAGKSNSIDQDAFVEGCLRLRGNAQRVDTAKLLSECQVLLRRISALTKPTPPNERKSRVSIQTPTEVQ
mmetsp:Transcript_78583/g.243804  ORF Transcript_78583/g.243804 Transcript_78583/m.243804 type:complete len:580 (+) Transcript_78583:49-1788(+)